MHILPTTTVYWLVCVSILTSIVAAYTAFSFAERMAASEGRDYRVWLAGGAVSMGLGVWSMHYIGMSAVRLPIEVAYHMPTVLLSLLLAVLASAVALVVVSAPRPRPASIACGSLLMGVGIGGMHYLGMHAMRCAAMHRYNPWLVALSGVIAVAFSWMAIWIASYVRRYTGELRWLRLGGAVVMGLGIAAMHYTAMAAVTFEGVDLPYPTRNTAHISTLGTVAIACTVAIILLGALTAALRDRKAHERLRKINEELERERDRFYAATESSMDSFFMCTAVRDADADDDIVDFVFTYLNTNVEKMVALPIGSLLGRRMCEVLPVNRTLGLFDRYREVVLTGEPLAYEFPIRHKDVLSSWIRVQAVKVGDGVAITASDITARKVSEERILHIAHHDALTGLLNRTLLHERISQAIEQARRDRSSAGVFFLDLDGFKQLNDTLGHAAGDAMLIRFGQRLLSAVRASDSVVRLGGDEFVVVMPGLASPRDAQACARALLTAMQPPMQIDDTLIPVSCSIGCALFPESATAIDGLLSHADAALYKAKSQGKNCFYIDYEEMRMHETTPSLFPTQDLSSWSELTASLRNRPPEAPARTQ